MKCLKVEKPRCLSLKALDWEDNNLMRSFRDCGLSDGFMKVWQLNHACNINQENGEYSNKKERRRSATSGSLQKTALWPCGLMALWPCGKWLMANGLIGPAVHTVKKKSKDYSIQYYKEYINNISSKTFSSSQSSRTSKIINT